MGRLPPPRAPSFDPSNRDAATLQKALDEADSIIARIDFWRSLPLPIIQGVRLNALASRLDFLSSWIEGTQLVPAGKKVWGKSGVWTEPEINAVVTAPRRSIGFTLDEVSAGIRAFGGMPSVPTLPGNRWCSRCNCYFEGVHDCRETMNCACGLPAGTCASCRGTGRRVGVPG